MKLEQSFDVEAPVDRVWGALVNVERVAPCLPGAAIDEVGDDGTYRGTFQVKLGPTTASYRGTLKIESADEATHRATMKAHGTDKRGQGSANATIVSTLSESGGVTSVAVETDFTITGRLARFGRGGMIEDISNRLMREFAECLQKTLGEPVGEPVGETADGSPQTAGAQGAHAEASPSTPARPIKGFSLFLSVLWERMRRLFRRR